VLGGEQDAVRRRSVRIGICLGSTGVGGSELNALRTVQNLVRDPGFDVSVYCMGNGPLTTRLQDTGARLFCLDVRGLWGRSALKAGVSFLRDAKARNIEVIHTQDVYGNVFFVPWARVARIPVVITSRRWQKYSPRRGIAQADRVASWLAHRTTANSEVVAKSLRSEYRLPRRRVVVFPNSLSPEMFNREGRVGLRMALGAEGIPADATIVGSVARLRPVKDLQTLIRATAHLSPRWPDLHVVIVGDGPEKENLSELTQELGLESVVHLVGERPNIPNPNLAFSVAVLTSLSEGSPNVLLEAMAVGVPVVATRVGGSELLVSQSRAGLLVEPGDHVAVAAALERFLSDRELASQYGQAGRDYAKTHHGERETMEGLKLWYRQLLCDKRGTPSTDLSPVGEGLPRPPQHP